MPAVAHFCVGPLAKARFAKPQNAHPPYGDAAMPIGIFRPTPEGHLSRDFALVPDRNS